jgi:hypothetical protein
MCLTIGLQPWSIMPKGLGGGSGFPDDARRQQVEAWADAGNADVVYVDDKGVIEMETGDGLQLQYGLSHHVDVLFTFVPWSEIDEYTAQGEAP